MNTSSERRPSTIKEYFTRYLLFIRGLSQSTVNHYTYALSDISKRLCDEGLLEGDIFDVVDVAKLEFLRQRLYANSDFIEVDRRGNRMWSAALNNYIRFASGEASEFSKNTIKQMDIPVKPEAPTIIEQTVWRRSNIIRVQSISASDYKCEIDESHQSFIAEATNHPYMEAHHIIPMKYQERFENSLDVYANVVCLCPVCHRRIHYGLKSDRKEMILRLYAERSDRLANSGIRLSSDEFVLFAVN